ncbi:PPC domain-containing protein [Pseudosporangium ferrugineum]|uniref:Pre-peptidase n=1 Tax=Pseudosporangium ferrugineum TaxID=439699 RepID=A0A2T0SJD0_9ACTN|nr:PPC domain-containing protein [Pseudosporangium ferrugineum]PRY33483.1 pre-peptidase [Pseudosporangium ferrugineum]
MRRSIATVGAVVLGLATLLPGVAQAAPKPSDPGLSPADQVSLAAGIPVAPKAALGARPAGPNPYLSMLPDAAKADYSGWANYAKKQAAGKLAARLKAQGAPSAAAKAASAVVVDENEPDGTFGSNDNPASAQLIKNFGTGKKQDAAIRILGSLDPESATPQSRAATPEDDGSIPLAGETGIGSSRAAIVTSAQVGDGPHGSAGTGTNDFDFYKLAATAGQTITVDTDTPTGDLDTLVALYTPDGTIVAANDDADGFDSLLKYDVPTSGTYYAVVAAYSGLPADPFDPASGDGGASEGPYTVTITAASSDVDFFAVNLKAGDVLGASSKGAAAYLTVYDTDPREAHGSDQDLTFIYPMDSKLPGGGRAVTDYVATKAGWHYIGVSQGKGSYDITVEGYRPPLEGDKPTQTLFLDFDGERVNTGVFGGTGNVTLSPFSAFLAKWGIPSVQEDALIDTVVATVTENLKQDLIESGLNSRFKLKILNSKDHADPWGQKNVSRIIIGGTIDESGVPTIGIAQSIDPGNFETEETALVLQDVLSEPAGSAPSLNTYLTADSDRIAFVGQAVGNVTAHEAGHFFGNWHTDNADETPNLMDAGGINFDVLFGVGPDGVGGTADDPDVDFVHDRFSPAEGFAGTEDTLGRIVFGVTS